MTSTMQVLLFLLPAVSVGGMIPTKEIVQGVHMPIVNCGTAPFPWSKRGERPGQIVSSWLGQGFRGVDTALNYFDQKVVGQTIASSGVAREDVFITTKVLDCDMVNGMWGRNYMEYDLKALGVDYIDLMLIHFPLGIPGSCPKAWKVLEKYVKDGKIKALGTSSFFPRNLKAIMDIATVPIAVNQIEYNVFTHDDPTIAFCDTNNITVEAWSPLKAFATGRSVFQDETVKTIAIAHNVSAAQVALRWIVQRGHMLAVLSGNPAHQANDADLWSFELTNDEMKLLTQLKNKDIDNVVV